MNNEKVKKAIVYGCGISGIGACRLLAKNGWRVTLYDENENTDIHAQKEKIGGAQNVDVIAGKPPADLLSDVSLAVLSPGVPTDNPLVAEMRDEGIDVIGEVELAYRYGRGDLLAVTGTNGKTTTTTLLGEIMRAYKKDDTFVVGNIGKSYSEAVPAMTDKSVTVAEISSFQMETAVYFHPRVSAILNISADHLNRHHTMENYIAAKEKIARNQTERDFCVLNFEDEVTRLIGERIKAKPLYFSSRRELEGGAYIKDGAIMVDMGGPKILCRISDLQLPGTHNYENVMAAALMAAAYGVPFDIIRKTVVAFKGVAHRIEYVCEKNGVTYYNDSKGTNPDASVKAVEAMTRPTVLIAGGFDKKVKFDGLISSFGDKVRHVVLFGQTKELIADTAGRMGYSHVTVLNTLDEAVREAARVAKPGFAVLFSPACASWDMFRNYEERGDLFKKYVTEM